MIFNGPLYLKATNQRDWWKKQGMKKIPPMDLNLSFQIPHAALLI